MYDTTLNLLNYKHFLFNKNTKPTVMVKIDGTPGKYDPNWL